MSAQSTNARKLSCWQRADVSRNPASSSEQPTLLTPHRNQRPPCVTMASHLCALPDEVLALCLGALGVSELSALACTARRYLAAARADALWKPLFAARFEQPSRLASAAAQRAGGWAKLFADCAANEKRDAPWTTPAPLLLDAYVAAMCGARDDQLALLFLVDGRRGTRAAQRGPSCIALAR